MSDHTAYTGVDSELSLPGHTALVTTVHQTRTVSLHCDDCPAYLGSFSPGRWIDKQIARAWTSHLAGAR